MRNNQSGAQSPYSTSERQCQHPCKLSLNARLEDRWLRAPALLPEEDPSGALGCRTSPNPPDPALPRPSLRCRSDPGRGKESSVPGLWEFSEGL